MHSVPRRVCAVSVEVLGGWRQSSDTILVYVFGIKHPFAQCLYQRAHHVLFSIFRTNSSQGPMLKDIPFEKGRHYGFEARVKLLNEIPGKPWQTIKAVVTMTLPAKGQLVLTIETSALTK